MGNLSSIELTQTVKSGTTAYNLSTIEIFPWNSARGGWIAGRECTRAPVFVLPEWRERGQRQRQQRVATWRCSLAGRMKSYAWTWPDSSPAKLSHFSQRCN